MVGWGRADIDYWGKVSHCVHGDIAGVATADASCTSDTTSATLTFLFYRLAANTDLTERLHHELKGVHIEDRVALVRLPLLNGVISETLRLHPALPSAVYRETPPSGLMVGERFIPGGTKILAPRWTIARCESARELHCDANRQLTPQSGERF